VRGYSLKGFSIGWHGEWRGPLVFLRGMGDRLWPSKICKNVREISFVFFQGEKIFRLDKIRFQDQFYAF
jgi:hypothetical protein